MESRTNTSTGTTLVTIADAVRHAQRKIDARDTAPGDFARWLIIAAAIFGAFMLMRAMRRVSGVALGLFWVWFWTHGAWRWIF